MRTRQRPLTVRRLSGEQLSRPTLPSNRQSLHNRCSFIIKIVILGLVSFLIGVRPLLAVDDLASIRAQYDAAVSSLDSFEIRYTMIQRRKQPPPNEPAQRTIKMLWSESGPNNKLLAIGDAIGADWNRWRSVFSFDGTRGYNGSCHEGDPICKQLRELHVAVGSDDFFRGHA